MNKIYSVVKNRAGNMTVASEIAKGAKKGRVVGAIASLSFVLLSNVSYADYVAGTGNNLPDSAVPMYDSPKVIVGENNTYNTPVLNPGDPALALTVVGTGNKLNSNGVQAASQTVVGGYNEVSNFSAVNAILGQNNKVTCVNGDISCSAINDGGSNVLIGSRNNIKATTDDTLNHIGELNYTNGNNIAIGTGDRKSVV